MKRRAPFLVDGRTAEDSKTRRIQTKEEMYRKVLKKNRTCEKDTIEANVDDDLIELTERD